MTNAAEALERLWQAWAEVGLSAHRGEPQEAVIDPEALIVTTLEAARGDVRLFDEMLDWTATNSDLLSLHRLRAVGSAIGIDPFLLGALISWVGAASPVRWRSDVPEEQPRRHLFDEDQIAFIPDPDPRFQEWGFVRPRVKRSLKSTRPSMRRPSTAAFAARSLFGVGSRADIYWGLTCSGEWLTASQIAQRAACSKASAHPVLASFSEGGFIEDRWDANRRQFRVQKRSSLLPAVGYYRPWIALGAVMVRQAGSVDAPLPDWVERELAAPSIEDVAIS